MHWFILIEHYGSLKLILIFIYLCTILSNYWELLANINIYIYNVTHYHNIVFIKTLYDSKNIKWWSYNVLFFLTLLESFTNNERKFSVYIMWHFLVEICKQFIPKSWCWAKGLLILWPICSMGKGWGRPKVIYHWPAMPVCNITLLTTDMTLGQCCL
jgi:hypothetical protein